MKKSSFATNSHALKMGAWIALLTRPKRALGEENLKIICLKLFKFDLKCQ